MRVVHLGLGNFARAHQAWYTDRAPDADAWGVAAFGGRTRELADVLEEQDGLYTLVTRAADGDRFDVVASISEAYGADDHDAWLRHLGSPAVRAVTLTVTEAGYPRDADGDLDRDRPDVRADIGTLRRDPIGHARTVPGRLLAGLAARHRADAGPLALVPCDNLPGNGAVAGRVLGSMAELVDSKLAAWLADSVSTVTTVVDRITPRTRHEDIRAVSEATGVRDRVPVVTEPFSEWVLCGAFPGGRPRWDDAGATFTDDIGPFEQRKLWLLNGAHSLLAYAGPVLGHTTVAAAIADETCRAWLEQWWDEASPHVRLPAADIAVYRAALVDRFTNQRMHHRLDQIAADGTQKLPVRILPVLRRERAAGRVPPGATRVLGAWVCYVRSVGRLVNDPLVATIAPLAAGPLPDAVQRLLATLAPALGDDSEVVAAVLGHAERTCG